VALLLLEFRMKIGKGLLKSYNVWSVQFSYEYSQMREWTWQINILNKSHQQQIAKHNDEIESLGQLVASLTKEMERQTVSSWN
jgi:hypothetical protein